MVSPVPDAVVYLITFHHVNKIYIGSSLYDHPDYWGSMGEETHERIRADHKAVGKPVEWTKTILWHGPANERLRVEMQKITEYRSNYRSVGYNLFPRILGENSFYELDWNPPRGSIPRGGRNPVTDMDEAHASWGTYAKRQHRPNEKGWSLATFTDLHGVETTLYHGPSSRAPYNKCNAHKKRMIDQLGLSL